MHFTTSHAISNPTAPDTSSARHSNDASLQQVLGSLRQHGYAIIENLAPELTQQAESDLERFFERAPMGTGTFTGPLTQRVARLVARSSACRELVTHPLVLQVVERLFEGECYHPQLALTQAIRVHPGQLSQGLHRDDNVFPFRHPRPPSVLFAMWALSEFSENNGATRLIPRSHTWDDARTPSPDASIAMSMPKGSVLLWEGATYHGAGSNKSDEARAGALFGYNLGWLRQYENQYLAVPPELARTLSPVLQDLLGYRNHGYLGSYENQDARALLQEPDLELPAPSDLFTEDLELRSRNRH